MTTAFELATDLYYMSTNGEGGTITRTGEALPQEGYFIGGKFRSLVFESRAEIDRGELGWWIGSNTPARFYGVWEDPETGKVYFDAVSHMNYEANALSLAKVRGELAIWDIVAGQEIRLLS